MKVKTSEATGLLLDWAASVAAGLEHADSIVLPKKLKIPYMYAEFQPSTCAWQGAPLLEQFSISTDCHWHEDPEKRVWEGRIDLEYFQLGSTQLLAGMRCLACTHFGDEIEVPEFLLEHLLSPMITKDS